MDPRQIPDLVARPRALTVTELNHQVRHLLEASFMQAWVEGELSSFSRPSSGHWYFTLKDNRCQVRCAMFRGFNQRIRAIPKEGDQVRIRGKVSLYENRGDYQIIAEHIEAAGLGALQQAFEALKQKLQQEGLFDEDRKKPVPALPRHIGVVTSPTGAAIHDIVTVLRRRFPAVAVTLYPTAVQGQTAAADIVRAIEQAQAHGCADVLIVGRGGGSLEDLWCFNEEPVARAIASCTIPVVSAVGHETDFTIADFVADLRAPTPSAAAEKLVPDQRDWLNQLASHQSRIQQSMRRLLQRSGIALSQLANRLRDPRRELLDRAQRLDELEIRLQNSRRDWLDRPRQTLDNADRRLKLQSPRRQLDHHRQQVQRLSDQLQQTTRRRLTLAQDNLSHLGQSLHLVSPLATLGRGYAIVQTAEQTIVRDAAALAPNDRITARLSQGAVDATVTRIHSEAEPGKPSASNPGRPSGSP